MDPKLPESSFSVVLAGGGGTRFWPYSRAEKPKQFLVFAGGRTLLQHSYDLVSPLTAPDRTLVVASGAHLDLVRAQLPDLPERNTLSEPFGRGTAAAVARAAETILGRSPDAVMTVLGADHWVRNPPVLREAVSRGCRVADRFRGLVAYGLVPTEPSTRHGYIIGGDANDGYAVPDVFPVARFHEKPPRVTAQKYLAQPNCYWNSGMFSWRADVVLGELALYAPNVLRRVREAMGAVGDPSAFSEAYRKIPAQSIDHALLEHATKRFVVATEVERVDLTTWASLGALLPADEKGNVSLGDVVMLDCKDTVQSGADKLVAAIGLENCIVVADNGVVLVCAKDRADEIGGLIDLVGQKGFAAPR